MSIKPIRPEEVPLYADIPDFVIKAVNTLIIRKMKDGQAVFTQMALVEELQKHDPVGHECSSDDYQYTQFSWKWCQFEEAYQNSGWIVQRTKVEPPKAFVPYTVWTFTPAF